MTAAAEYFGPVEALTFEQAAARLSCSVDTIKEHYDGPIVCLGTNGAAPRIAAYALHDWLVARSSYRGKANGNTWDSFGDGEKPIQAPKQGEAS